VYQRCTMTLSPTPTLSSSNSRLLKPSMQPDLSTPLLQQPQPSLPSNDLEPLSCKSMRRQSATQAPRSTYPVLLTPHHVAPRAYPHTGTSSHALVHSRISSVLSRLPKYLLVPPTPTTTYVIPQISETLPKPLSSHHALVADQYHQADSHAPHCSQRARITRRPASEACTLRLEIGVIGKQEKGC